MVVFAQLVPKLYVAKEDVHYHQRHKCRLHSKEGTRRQRCNHPHSLLLKLHHNKDISAPYLPVLTKKAVSALSQRTRQFANADPTFRSLQSNAIGNCTVGLDDLTLSRIGGTGSFMRQRSSHVIPPRTLPSVMNQHSRSNSGLRNHIIKYSSFKTSRSIISNMKYAGETIAALSFLIERNRKTFIASNVHWVTGK